MAELTAAEKKTLDDHHAKVADAVSRGDLAELDRLQGDESIAGVRRRQRGASADELVRGWWTRYAGPHLQFRAVRACVRLALFGQHAVADSVARRAAEIHLLADRIAAQDRRIAELEESAMRYEGTHEPERTYGKNAAVTHRNGLWIAQRATCDTPGTSDAWRLAARGQR